MIPPAYYVGTAAVTENLLKRKWSAIILRHLANNICDPAEICKIERDISPAAMNERLRNMLRFCLIARYPRASPSKVIEYKLTARGHKILKVLNFIDQLDDDASQQNHQEEERTLVTIRRKKTTSPVKKGIILDDSVRTDSQPPIQSVKYA